MKNLYSDGFTLIETLVVITIIGIILALSTFGLQGARKATRDAQRKSDLEAIRSALELYKSDNGQYPGEAVGVSCDTSAGTCIYPCSGCNGTDWSGTLIKPLLENGKYISYLPIDPINKTINSVGYNYYYEPNCGGLTEKNCAGQDITCPVGVCCAYKLFATLESTGQPIAVCSP